MVSPSAPTSAQPYSFQPEVISRTDASKQKDALAGAKRALSDQRFDLNRDLPLAIYLSKFSDQASITASAKLYCKAGTYYFKIGKYNQAKQMFDQAQKLAKLLPKGKKASFPLYDNKRISTGTNNHGIVITISPTKRSEKQFISDGHKTKQLGTSLTFAEAAKIRSQQCEFMMAAGNQITNPFNLNQVGAYLQSLQPAQAMAKLGSYFKAFYFHTDGNVPDHLNEHDSSWFPPDNLGRKPSDCKIFVQMANSFFARSFSQNVSSQARSKLAWLGVRTSSLNRVLKRPKYKTQYYRMPTHIVLLIETGQKYYLVNNTEVTLEKSTDLPTIHASLSKRFAYLNRSKLAGKAKTVSPQQ